jgi:hypothetical protein
MRLLRDLKFCPPNPHIEDVQGAHHKPCSYSRIAGHFCRYSATKKDYVVFKFGGKTKWVPPGTTGREIAGRKAKDGIEKFKKTNTSASVMTLEWRFYRDVI